MLLSYPRACELLSVSLSTVERLVKRGVFTPVCITEGRKGLIEDEVRAFAAKRIEEAREEAAQRSPAIALAKQGRPRREHPAPPGKPKNGRTAISAV